MPIAKRNEHLYEWNSKVKWVMDRSFQSYGFKAGLQNMWQPGSRAARHFLWNNVNISSWNIVLLLSFKNKSPTDVEKGPEKMMLEKVPAKLRGKLML